VPRSVSKSVSTHTYESILKERNGIYSYFIRATNIRLTPADIEKLRQYAIKVIEGEELILIVGRNWIVLARKIDTYDNEYVPVRCFRDICEPHNEIEYREVLLAGYEPTGVDVVCREHRKVDIDVVDYDCEVRYNYIYYEATVAITIDPLDVQKINSDEELQLLVDLLPEYGVLVRPM
jgi:hypothetical protein